MASRVMSSDDALKTANSLFVDENYDEALANYNLSIELDNQNPEALLKRSACLQKMGKLTGALADVNALLKLTTDNATQSKGLLRKGMICFDMEEFETAKSSFEKGYQCDPSNSTFRTWIRKCNAELEIEDMEIETPKPISTPAPSSAPATSAPAPTTPAAAAPTPVQPQSAPVAQQQAPVAPKVRHEWYQTATHVFVSLFAKGVKQDQANIEIQEKTLTATIKLSHTNEFVFDIDLFDKIVPSESTTSFLSTKVEIKLKKANSNRWKELEGTGEQAVAAPMNTSTSSSGPNKPKKNWDAIAKEVDGEKLDGDEGLNKVFQDIYANGSEEQKRAMMKSFMESGGTVLSTNWDEVGKGEVKGSPPDGLEMHKWKDLTS